MSEAGIQTGIQTALRAMAEFASADVVINDWSILDQSNANAPYVIITASDQFNSNQAVRTPENSWSVPIILYERFTTWKTTLDNFVTRRQAIIDKINTGIGLPTEVARLKISAGGPITSYFDKGIDPKNYPEADPIFLFQTILIECMEW